MNMIAWKLSTRTYSTRRMRLHQALAARAKGAWEPLRSAIEDEPMLQSRITAKKFAEQKTKPAKSLVQYLQSRLIGRPRTGAEKREAWLNAKKRQFSPVFLDQLKPQMRKWKSALSREELPPELLPEIAVVGRSNTGKSTLLNALSGRGSALVSSRPGSTQSIDFYKIGKPALLSLVDLPGYGYADASEAKRLQWTEFSLEFLKTRSNLKRVLVLVDARWGVFDADKEMLAYLVRNRVPWQLVLTKCDLVPAKHLAKRITLLQDELKHFAGSAGPVIPISAKKKQGMDDLRKTLSSLKIDKQTLASRLRRINFAKSQEIRPEQKTQSTASEPLTAEETLKKWGIDVDEEVQSQSETKSTAEDKQPSSSKHPQRDREAAKANVFRALKSSRRLVDNEVIPLVDAPAGKVQRTGSSPARKPQTAVIGRVDRKSAPKGIGKWKVLGRPESKAPRMRPRVDVNDLVKAADVKKKKMKAADKKQAKTQSEPKAKPAAKAASSRK